tara:strand:- start:18704 stop:19279 length:576 start_codon:yes stop_codon:yes gene_type:complete
VGIILTNGIYLKMSWYNIYREANKTSYGWTCVHTPESISKKTIDFSKTIPDRELFKEQEGWEDGIEDKPHITVLYGLETLDVKKVENALHGEKGGTVELGKVDVFESEEYDVLIVRVKSRALHKLHKCLDVNLKNVNSFPKYQPHITLAYLKCGNGKTYKNDNRFEGLSFEFNEIMFEDSKDRKTDIVLNV